jgi:DsbC/DsbD-like thiol-disulfide interchange protein
MFKSRIALCLLFMFAYKDAHAQTSKSAPPAQASLIEGAVTPQNTPRFGLKITLGAGYKTYWRTAGESGISPVLEWSGSENIKTITVSWPTPDLLFEGGISFNGYADSLLIPLEVSPQNREKPIKLRLSLSYAVCKTQCIPLSAHITYDTSAGLSPDIKQKNDLEIQAARAQTPTLVELDQIHEGLSIKSTSLIVDAAQKPQKLRVEIAAASTTALNLFVEAPASWVLGTAVMGTDSNNTYFDVPILYAPSLHAAQSPAFTFVLSRAAAAQSPPALRRSAIEVKTSAKIVVTP